VHSSRYRFRQGMWKESAPLFEKTMVGPDDRVGGGRAQTNDQLRPHDRKFGFEPWSAGGDFGARWLLMDPPLAPLFEFEMLHGIGDVDIRARDSGIDERAIEERTRRPYERTSSEVFAIARLLAHYHHPRGRWTFSKNSLSGIAIKVTALAVLSGSLQLLQCYRLRG